MYGPKITKPSSPATVQRTLASRTFSKKTLRRVAQERNVGLVDYHSRRVAKYKSFNFVPVNESHYSRRDGFRRIEWAPKDVTPVLKTKLQRGRQHQILAAYCQDSILLLRVFTGTTDATIFEDFVEQLLYYCKSTHRTVIVLDNASIHRSERVRASPM